MPGRRRLPLWIGSGRDATAHVIGVTAETVAQHWRSALARWLRRGRVNSAEHRTTVAVGLPVDTSRCSGAQAGTSAVRRSMSCEHVAAAHDESLSVGRHEQFLSSEPRSAGASPPVGCELPVLRAGTVFLRRSHEADLTDATVATRCTRLRIRISVSLIGCPTHLRPVSASGSI